MKRRLLSAFLVVLMLLTMLPTSTIEVFAAGITNVKSEVGEEKSIETPTEDVAEEVSEEETTETEGETEESVSCDEEATEEDSESSTEETTQEASVEESATEIREEESTSGGDVYLAETYGDYSYTISGNDACITGYSGSDTVLKVPAKINGYTVKSIGEKAFGNNTNLKQVVLPDDITLIDDKAFINCYNMISIQLPANLNTIGWNAFDGCSSLTGIKIPKTLKDAGVGNIYSPFTNCTALKTIELEEGLTSIPTGLFYGCSAIEEITIPKSVISIGEQAFYNCTNLKKVTFSPYITYIGKEAFAYNYSLQSVELPAALVELSGKSFAACTSLTEIVIPKNVSRGPYGYGAPFRDCTNLKKVTFEQGMKVIPSFILSECYVEEVVIPDSVTNIDNAAFWKAGYLKKVVMPDSVNRIGTEAFLECVNLQTIHLPKSLSRLEMGAFKNCTSLNNITIPKSLSYALGPFDNCSGLKNVTFEEGINTIIPSLFDNCTGLESITLPEDIVGIDAYAFDGCTSLQKVNMSDKVQWISDRAFYNCVNLKDADLPLSLQSLGAETYGNCYSLTSIYIPKSLTSVKTGISHPFRGCSSLKTATFEEGTKVVIKNLFENCGSLETVILPETITEIHQSAFSGCSSLKNIELPSQMTYIAQKAFYCCTVLEQIELPSTLAYVFPDCFYGCSALKEITIPAGITGIGARAFQKCTALEKVTFEKNGVISAIEDYAFADCSALKSFTLPNTVEKLGMGALATCASLTEVSLGTGLKAIPSYFLDNSAALEEVLIPYQVTAIASSAFARSPKLKKVTIPANVTSIASDIFSYPGEVTIYGVEGSYAQTYANENGISFVAQTVPATDISIETEQMELNIGATKVITHNVLPVDFTDTLIWSSSDKKIATVEAGKVTGVKSGTVTITVKSKENSNLKATCKVKVVQPVTKIELSATNKTLNAADTFDLNPKVSPDNAYNKKLHFYSENESIATVSEDGVVTARLQGTTKIYASSTDGSDVKTYCRVEVKGWAYWIENPENLESAHPYYNGQNDLFIYEDPKAEKLRLTFSKDTFVEDGKDTISVLNGNNKVIGTYTGSELAGKVVEVPGSAVRIKLVTDSENVFYGFKVDKLEVVEKTVQLKSISLNESNVSLKKGAQSKLEVIYNPENTNVDKTITWSSDNEAVATVKEDGTVVGVSSGIATITAKVKDKKATCKVYVWEGVTKVTLKANKNVLFVGEQGIIEYSLAPLHARTKEIKISSSNKAVASVNLLEALNKVEIIPLKEGKTTITVNIDGVKATCNITVSNTLSLDYQDGSGKVEKVSVTYNQPLSVLETKTPARKGYYFIGWYTQKAGEGEAVNAETILTHQRTLYAHWQKISDEFFVTPVGDQMYTGKAHKPAIQVYDGAVLLEENVDYKVSYKNNVKASDASAPKNAPSVIVKGINNYKGTVTVTFKILPQNISGQEFSADNLAVVYKAKKVQKPTPVLSWKGKKLKAKTDFTVSYPDTQEGAYKNPGVYNVIISGKGNFTGEKKVTLNITQATLMSKVKVSKIANQEYQNGAPVMPELVVKYGKETLVKGVHYEVTFENNRQIGTATAVLVGKDAYSGVKRVTFKITGPSIAKAKVSGIGAKTYDGTPQMLDLAMDYNGTALVKGKDYEVSYQKNVNVGTATILIKGINSYSGTLKKTFKILPCDMGTAADQFKYRVNGKVYTASAFASLDMSCAYEKGGSKPYIEVYSVKAAKWLKEGKDYSLTYTANTAITTESTKKTPVVSVVGKGNYKGKVNKTFKIVAGNIASVHAIAADKPASAKAGAYLSKPVFTDGNGKVLKEGTDYTIAGYTAVYPDKTSEELTKKSAVSVVGTKIVVAVNGKGTYTGETKVTYLITEKSFKGVKIAKISRNYTGKEILLSANDFVNADGSSKVTIKDGKVKKELVYGKDFVIVEGTYRNNIKKGTATVMIKGCGEYGGTMQLKFTISQKPFFLK